MLHLFSEIPLLLFSLPPTNPNQFCNVTWPLLPSSPISLLLIVVIFYSPVFAKCCLSCLPICTSSVRTLSVNFLFVTPSCSCRKSLCWIGCCLLLPHLSFSSNSWWRWDCDDKTAQKPPQQRWRDCNVGASEISFDFAARPPWRWWWRHVGDLLEFLTAARLRWRDCTATSSMTVARLRYRRISNHLQFGGVTSLTMAMAARRKSSRILDGGNTAMSAHRQPPWQRLRATR